MHVGLTPGQAGAHIDTSAVPDAARVAISSDGYIEDNLDGLFTALVGPYYARHRNEYMERLRLIYSEDTGRALINSLNLIGEQTCIYPILDFVLPPQNDAGAASPANENPLVRYVNRAIQIDNGQVIWDPLCMPLDARDPEYAQQYRQVETSLVDLRRQLEASRSPASGASGSAHPSAVPADPAPAPAAGATASKRTAGLNAARPYHLPVWNGKTRSVTLFGDLRIHVGKGSAAHKEDVKAVLAAIARTAPGQILFSELSLCAKKGAALIVAEGNGKSGLTTTGNGDVVWLFDERDLTRRCIQRGLAGSDKPVYSAFVDLVAARDALGARLRPDSQWISGNWQDRRTAVDQFYQHIKADIPMPHVDGVARSGNPVGGQHALDLSGAGHPNALDTVVHPQDPGPAVTANIGRMTPDTVADNNETDPARDSGAPGASRGYYSGIRADHRIWHRVTDMMRSLQTRLGLRNAPGDPMQNTRAYDALVATVPNYSVPNPYTTISRQ